MPVKEQELKKQTTLKDVTLPKVAVKEEEEVAEDVHMEEIEEQQDEEVRQFPEGVLDIDALEDQNNPQVGVEYAPAIYAYLREVEDGLSIRKDFLSGCFVNGKMRAVLIDWLIEVHSLFKLLQETLYMTIYIIDKFLQVRHSSFLLTILILLFLLG